MALIPVGPYTSRGTRRPITQGVKIRSGYPTVWSECRWVTKATRSLVGWSAVMLLLVAAALARRTTPGPKSTRYAVSLTTIAVAGPDRSGVAAGVPVPRRTTFVWLGWGAGEGCWAAEDTVTTPMAHNAAGTILKRIV